jgi:5-methylcytosine-specific restriction endonuclease McrA
MQKIFPSVRDGIEGKVCTRCGQWKPLSEYPIRKDRPCGIRAQCNECARDAAASYQAAHADVYRARAKAAREANPELCKEKLREWRARNPDVVMENHKRWYKENAEYAKVRSRQWRLDNLERAKAKRRADYAEHREEEIRAAMQWKLQHPEKACAYEARRRAKLAGASGIAYTTAEHIRDRWAMWGNRCWICGAPATATDHVKPLAKGGAHWPCNLRPICTACNSMKHDKWPFYADLRPSSSLAITYLSNEDARLFMPLD